MLMPSLKELGVRLVSKNSKRDSRLSVWMRHDYGDLYKSFDLSHVCEYDCLTLSMADLYLSMNMVARPYGSCVPDLLWV